MRSRSRSPIVRHSPGRRNVSNGESSRMAVGWCRHCLQSIRPHNPGPEKPLPAREILLKAIVNPHGTRPVGGITVPIEDVKIPRTPEEGKQPIFNFICPPRIVVFHGEESNNPGRSRSKSRDGDRKYDRNDSRGDVAHGSRRCSGELRSSRVPDREEEKRRIEREQERRDQERRQRDRREFERSGERRDRDPVQRRDPERRDRDPERRDRDPVQRRDPERRDPAERRSEPDRREYERKENIKKEQDQRKTQPDSVQNETSETEPPSKDENVGHSHGHPPRLQTQWRPVPIRGPMYPYPHPPFPPHPPMGPSWCPPFPPYPPPRGFVPRAGVRRGPRF